MNRREMWNYLIERYDETLHFIDTDFGYRMWNRLHRGAGALEELDEFKNLMRRLNCLIRGVSYYVEIGGKRDVSSWISKINETIAISLKLHEAYQAYIREKR